MKISLPSFLLNEKNQSVELPFIQNYHQLNQVEAEPEPDNGTNGKVFFQFFILSSKYFISLSFMISRLNQNQTMAPMERFSFNCFYPFCKYFIGLSFIIFRLNQNQNQTMEPTERFFFFQFFYPFQ